MKRVKNKLSVLFIIFLIQLLGSNVYGQTQTCCSNYYLTATSIGLGSYAIQLHTTGVSSDCYPVTNVLLNFGDGSSQNITSGFFNAFNHKYTFIASDCGSRSTPITANLTINGIEACSPSLTTEIENPDYPYHITAVKQTCKNYLISYNNGTGTAPMPLPNAQWAFGDGTFAPASGTSTQHTFPSNGTYSVTLTGDGLPCPFVVKLVTVNDIADPGFTYTVSDYCTAVTSGIDLNISNYNSAYSYFWSINGTVVTASSTGNTITTGLIAGGNIIKLTATSIDGCYSEVSKVIHLGAPAALFSVFSSNPSFANTLCVGDILSVGGVSAGGDVYTWTITKTGGSPQTQTGINNPFYQFNTEGTYTVSLTITNNYIDGTGATVSCNSTPHVETITVNQQPDATFSFSSTTGNCNGTVTLNLPVNTGMTSYSLNYGDGTVLTGTTSFTAGHETHHYNTNGVFTVSLVVNGGPCTATNTHNVVINDNVTLALVTPSAFLCPGSALTLAGVLNNIPSNAGTLTYAWSGPSSFTSSQTQINVTAAGTYSLTITSDGSCSINVSRSININQLAVPTATVTGTPTIDCSAGTTNASLEIAQALALQGFCINGVCTAANPGATGPVTATVSGLVAGDNYVTIANGKDHTCSRMILIHVDQNLPVVVLTKDQPSDCSSNGSASVSSTISSSNTKWYTVANYPTTSFETGNSASALSAGTYVVEVSNGNCKVTNYFDIILPVINLSLVNNDPSTCSGGTVQVDITVQSILTGLSYVWEKKDIAGVFQSHSGSTGSESVEPGNYQVTVSSGGCSSILSFEVKEYDPIAVAFNVELPGCTTVGQVHALTSGGDGNYNYTWTLGVTSNETTNPFLSLAGVTTSTTVQVVVTDGSGCATTYPSSPYSIDPPAGVELCDPSIPTTSVTINDCDISVCVTGGVSPYNFEWYRIGDKTSTVERFFTYDAINNILKDDQGITITPPASQSALDAAMTPNPNTDGDVATFIYPYWNFPTNSDPITPQLTSTGTPYSVTETVITPNTEFYVTAYSGTSNQTSDNGNFETGEYKVKVTDANGCIYDLPVGHLDFTLPTGFKVRFDFVWGLNRKEEAPVADDLKVDKVLSENMAEAASEMLDAAEKCRQEQSKGLANSLKTECSNLANFKDALSINYNITEHHYTLYYYDRAGQLTKTIPPEGVEFLSPAEIAEVKLYRQDATVPSIYLPAHRMPTTYQYNSMAQLIGQNTPDGGTSNFIYDGKSRLRFSQNAKQLADGKYSYTKYDELGRITEVGESALTGLVFGTSDATEKAANLSNANLAIFPATDNKQITHTVYSDPAPASVTYYGKPQRYLQNRVSYVFIDNDPALSGDEYYTYYSYDSHGNVEWLIQQDQELGKNFIAYEYDLISGKVLKVRYNENRMDRFFHRYSYDVQNRLCKVETSRDGELWDADAKYKYYPHGPLQRNEIGEDNVQGLDNIYTIQGWIKAVNTPHLNSSDDPGSDNGNPNPVTAGLPFETYQVARDRFGMILNYYKGDYTRSGSYLNNSASAPTPANLGVNDLYAQANTSTNAPDLYNGNISSWVHSQLDVMDPTGSAPKVARADLFKYDVLNRIKQNVDLQQNGISWNAIGAGANAADTYKTGYTYDANGNILTLNRFDQAGDQMDNLSYTYDNGASGAAFQKNQLSAVNEGTGTNTVDGRGDIEGAHTYTYDGIGNLITDVSQERLADNSVYGLHTVTTDISWTVYGKIKEILKDIDFAGNHHKERITFSYDASGNRTKKEVWIDRGSFDAQESGEEISTTFYVRDAQGNVLSVYTKDYNETAELYQYKLIEQPMYGSDRIGQNIKNVILSEAPTLLELLPPADGISTISEYQNWITSTNKTSLLPGGNDKLCACKIQKLAGASYSTVTTTAEFLGIAENGIAVAENLAGELQFYVVLAEKYLGNNDACLVYDKSGKLMKGTELIGGIDTKSKPIITNIPGTNKYAVVTLSNNKLPVYHVIDMDAAGYGTTPITGAIIAGELIAHDLPMTNYAYTSPTHGWHFTAYEDHINGKRIVYNTRYTPDQAEPITGKTEIMAYEFNSDYNVQPQEHILYELNGCGKTETGELQISPEGNKLVWYQHDKNVSGFDYRLADVYTFDLNSDKTSVIGTANYAAGTTQAGNHGEGRVEFMKNNEDLLYSQRGVYKELATGYDKNTWKYEKVSNLTAAINPAAVFNPTNGIDPVITYLFSEIRRGVDGNYYMPNMGEPADKIHSYTGTAWNSDLNANASANELASSLPTQVFKLFAASSQTLTEYGRSIGNKRYELKDHLGNVRVVVSDEKNIVDANTDYSINSGDYFVPTILSFNDYFAFGQIMPGRSYSSNTYRYGFNGKERDPEMGGSTYDYGFRIYNPSIARFLSLDPLFASFPSFSPYHYAGNNPIKFIDLDGLEKVDPTVEIFYKTAPKIDMRGAPAGSALNAAGYERNGPWFWRQVLKSNPEMFSSSNVVNVKAGLSPIIDDVWVASNPSSAGYTGKLIHHHIDQKNMAVGIPEKVHLNFFKELHPELGRKVLRGAKIGAYGAVSALSFFGDVLSVANGNPDALIFMLGRMPTVGAVQKDQESGAYFTPTKIEKTFYEDGTTLKSVTQTADYYSDFGWSEEQGKYVGLNKTGTKTEYAEYNKNGTVTATGEMH